MGSRGRSIRLRIYFLVAIPLITMLGLFGYVAYSSITTWLNQDRAPNLINATSEPLTNFVNVLQAERGAAVIYLSRPDVADLSAYENAVTATKNGQIALEAALNSAGTKDSTTASENAAIAKMTGDLASMTSLRAGVKGMSLAPLGAFEAYTNIIADQGAILQAEANSITDVAAVEQGLGLIAAVNTQEDVSEQQAVLAGAIASGSLTAADRVAFSQAAGRLQDDTMLYQQLLTPAELSTYDSTLNRLAPKAVRNDLTLIQQGVPAGTTLAEMERQGLSLSSWQLLTGTWLHAASAAGTSTASTVLAANSSTAIAAKRRVWETSTIGAAGLILTLIVTILLGRSINRRLTLLRRAALTLAEEQLPAVVARLRRGESVDAAAEAPPLRVGSDEIGQVGQAIDTVRQTAIRAAVDEAMLRRGVNDVFRNLARRNQSLLQRQLTVLDSMERRATDPDVLEDLFKMDHLTTRMRRHAEGLIILSGAAPGRGWSAPVKLIDVMRGAVAEIEDYARVAVATQSKAALSGSAVTDVIHLLAELIENATTLSPPFTQVRVSGESVGTGFAIEIEDRGLGLTPQRMAELNERLANPPDINPANTEQLGLFVVGQLARRHGISVALRPSPYGGVTAVTLIPERLIVAEGPAAITAGGAPAAMADTQPGMNSAQPGMNGAASEPYGSRLPYGPAAAAGSYGPSDGYAGNGAGYGANGGGYTANGGGYPGAGGDYPRNGGGYPASSGYPGSGSGYQGSGSGYQGSGSGYPGSGFPGSGFPGDGGAYPGSGAGYGRQGQYGGTSEASGAAPGVRRGRHGASDVPVVTGVPVSRPAGSSFDVFTPLDRSGEDRAVPEGRDDVSYAESHTNSGGGSNGAASHADDGFVAGVGTGDGTGDGDGDGGYGDGGSEEYKGLPRRVRQANLAPQLRSSVSASPDSPSGVPRATAASLSDMRNTLSAMQRGWQQGRSRSQQETEGNADGD